MSALETNKITRELAFSITPNDCELQTFRSGGSGGQNQNKRDTGVRWIHHPSGARGESREERSQLQNKKLAWERMAKHPLFTYWISVQLKNKKSQEELLKEIEEELADSKNLKIEIKKDKKWTEVSLEDLT